MPVRLRRASPPPDAVAFARGGCLACSRRPENEGENMSTKPGRAGSALATGAMLAGLLAAPSTFAGPVTSDDLVKAPENAKEWLTYGRDYRNWRFSPLAEITPETASRLAPVWAMSTGGQFGGLEATPLFRDGVLYFSADYARVFAIDAKSGNIIWRYEPEYEEGFNAILCCGP